ncbi:helix-turn-helix transcriptional regulator [Niabella aurantiaca]|uniref:helix-turn-helix transcriptional regulator n=1 Tax=Niabella aurantiaca TaxID=379900 RepID=UPI0003A5AB3B|nr:helix-turn-helix transcriptional regulator [Niabella aurantiaca]
MEGKSFNRIKAVLAEQKTTQKELAIALGVAEGTVSTWCRNFKQPEIQTLFKIAWHLKIEAYTLISPMEAAGLIIKPAK